MRQKKSKEATERVLVTGAGGYIGAVLVPLLLDAGYAVRAVDRFFFGADVLPRHPALDVCREDTRRMPAALLSGVRHVIDLAALSNDPSGETFHEATWAINHEARLRTARLARDAGVARYILPSSCSVYGAQPPDCIADEDTAPNPLTTYARANLAAERDILPLAAEGFAVVAIRQATVYGVSPRMRLDLAINGMTLGAWESGKLPLMRDGSQWRPMVHVADTSDAMRFLLEVDADRVTGRVFNIGSARNNYRIADLGDIVAGTVPRPVEIDWYGDPDTRSYRVSFDRIEALGYRASRGAEDGVREIVAALEAGELRRSSTTITLDRYRELIEWHRVIKDVELYGGILDIR
ncbi:MAG: NAD-dependent epimerase/dehydratase family protein [Alphaproteobacteria bacterium]